MDYLRFGRFMLGFCFIGWFGGLLWVSCCLVELVWIVIWAFLFSLFGFRVFSLLVCDWLPLCLPFWVCWLSLAARDRFVAGLCFLV